MMPASQPATSRPPKRGLTATTSPAAISTTPTMCIASCALPGIRSLNSGARYLGQSEISTSANLSRPKRIGATANTTRRSMNACAVGSRRSVSGLGTGIGLRAVAMLVMGSPLRESWDLGLLATPAAQLLRRKNWRAAVAKLLMTVAYAGLPVDPSEAWLEALRSDGPRRRDAIADLHDLLLRAARFEIGRRRAALSFVRGEELEDLALQAANDALVAVLAKLDDYRGASRFTTWAYKFALLEAGVRLRRRAWQGREVVLEPESWPNLADAGQSPERQAEANELMLAITDSIDCCLTDHQREVLVALALNGVPLDVLSDRLNTTRGALYKTLHDARRKLRAELATRGFALDSI